MVEQQVLNTQRVLTKVFDALEDPENHQAAWHFFTDVYPQKTFPVNEDGWGVRLPCGLEYSVSECSGPNIRRGSTYPYEQIAVDSRRGREGEIRILVQLDNGDLRKLDQFAKNLTKKWEKWLRGV